LNEELVEALARLLHDRGGLLDLLGRTGHRHLAGGQVHLAHRTEQPAGPGAPPAIGPRRAAGLLDAALGLGPPRVGDPRDPLAVALEAVAQPLVLQQLEAGVDRARRRTPRALALVLDALHDLVAVAGALGQDRQQCGADVAPPPAAIAPAHAGA